MKIILASGSPRRGELLQLICETFEVLTSHVDEEVPKGLSAEQTVLTLAQRKAAAVFENGHQRDLVIGADTVVELNSAILGKPHTPQRAVEMLRLLQGREHSVHTAVQVLSPQGRRAFAGKTQVRFSPMTDWEIEEYVKTGEPLDKAGAYGIQGRGARYIEGITGDYYTVMGLPVNGLYRLLRELLEEKRL